MCSTLEKTPGLILKHQTRLEKLARGRHSSLLPILVNYGLKKIYKIMTRGQCYKTFLSVILHFYAKLAYLLY